MHGGADSSGSDKEAAAVFVLGALQPRQGSPAGRPVAGCAVRCHQLQLAGRTSLTELLLAGVDLAGASDVAWLRLGQGCPGLALVGAGREGAWEEVEFE